LRRCDQAGLNLPPLGPEARGDIDGILKGFGWAANPADVTGFAISEFFPQIMEALSCFATRSALRGQSK
jgi:hypothetical protein